MLTVGLIGFGAIAQYVTNALPQIGAKLSFVLVREGREDAAKLALGSDVMAMQAIGDQRPDLIVDCAGHAGLRNHGPEILRAGVSLITVSIGALADDTLHAELKQAADDGGSRLLLSTGAIGSLDALASASVGRLDSVTYTGRKPPLGWKGSPAEDVLDLDALPGAPAVHFDGSARDAAVQYPKNANVAAAVALASLGFDKTLVKLIADPNISSNIHEIHATGDFGEMTFSILGKTLPDNPRTSALAAMSVVKMIQEYSKPMRF
jgi:aspartate dehydrogenase